jgi:hypothetical protein
MVVLLTFWPRPLYKNCLGRRVASVSTPYECSRSHRTSSFAPELLERLHLLSSIFSFTPFHVLTCSFRPYIAHFLWIKERIFESYAFISHLWEYQSEYLGVNEIYHFKLRVEDCKNITHQLTKLKLDRPRAT